MRNRTLHRWLGLGAGAWLAWLGLTGSLLALVPYLEGHSPSGPGRRALAATLADLPAGVRRVDFAAVDRYYVGEKRVLTVDPPTGRVLADQNQDQTMRARLLSLHELGGRFTGLVACAGGLLLLTGWRLQPPSRRRILQRPSGTWAWHRWLGWLSTPGLGLAMATGFVLVNYGTLEWALGKSAAPPRVPFVERGTRAQASGSVELPPEELVNAALRAVPAGQPTRLHWPTPKAPSFQVRLRQPGELNPLGRTFVHVHPMTGAVVLIENPLADPPAVRLLQGAFPIHAGLYPGGFWLIGLGLAPSAMWVTGLILRSRRKNRQTIKS